ncbi:hypothetical protein ACPA9J_31900 [Pseudomonas aeruginosa]
MQTHIDVLVDATGLDDYPLAAEHARQAAILRRCSNCWSNRRPPWPTRACCHALLETATRPGWTELLEASTRRRHLMLLFSPGRARLGEHLQAAAFQGDGQGRSAAYCVSTSRACSGGQ